MLNKKLGKLISVLLTVLLIFVSVPTFSIFADSIYSGNCGDNLTWTLDSDGLLTISGIGKMYDYDYLYSPWHSYSDSIKTVEIKNGVISIGDWAFSYCNKLTTVTIGNDVTSIGFSAFECCENLENITIPDSVTVIKGSDVGIFAFAYSAYYFNESNWDDGALYIGHHLIATKPDLSVNYDVRIGTKTIADHAFGYNSEIISITIPDSVISICEYAFIECDSLTYAYYTGSKEQRNQIEIASYNDDLLNANWVYNYAEGTVSYDITGDGYIDSSDLALIVNNLIYGEKYNKAYDLNNDGNVNILDLIAMKKQIANM